MVTTPRTRSFRILVCVALILSLLTFNAAVSPGLTSVTVATAAPLSFDTATRARVNATYGRLPLYFEANQGQTDPQVRFLARGGGQTLFLTSTEAVLVLTKADSQAQGPQRPLIIPVAARAGRQAVLRMAFAGASPQPRIAGQRELAGKVNYFLGNDPAKWRPNVPTYAAVRYEGLYPGIDLVYYGNNRQLEYDLVVAPGADPSQIALTFEGADRLEIDATGDLVLHTAVGTIHQRRPIVYQQTNGIRSEVAGAYVLRGGNDIGFQVAAFDGSRPLIIDPVLAYSTLLGGSGWDAGYDIVVDAGGNAYVTGFAGSTDFPTTLWAFQTAHSPFNPRCEQLSICFDAFVTKLNPIGSALVYSTYLGGSELEMGNAIAVDAAGSAYVTGYTYSMDFPTTPAAFHPTPGVVADAFVTKLNLDGSGLAYSTYLGGSGGDAGYAIAVDAGGNAYVTGSTGSVNFPTTPGAFQPVHGSYYWFLWLTLHPDPNLCPNPNTCLPADAFITKLNPAGSALVYSTYLGGTDSGGGSSIAIDAEGNVHVTGGTASLNFPTTVDAFQHMLPGCCGSAFVAKINPSYPGVLGLLYSTYLGGTYSDSSTGIAVDMGGNAYVVGTTSSSDFPTTPGAFQTSGRGAFILKIGYR